MEFSNSFLVGFKTHLPSIKPTLDAPTGPLKGNPEIDNAGPFPGDGWLLMQGYTLVFCGWQHDVLPSGPGLISGEVELRAKENRELYLHSLLRGLKDHYDYTIIDCPPALNLLTINGLRAARSLLVPMQCEYFALEGLAALLDTVDQLNEKTGHNLELSAIVRTMFDPRNKLTHLVTEELSSHFSDVLFSTTIPRNIKLAEAPSFGEPVLSYEPNAKGAVAYLALAGELIEKTEGGGVCLLYTSPSPRD